MERDPNHVHAPTVSVTVTLREKLMGRKQLKFFRCGGCLGAVWDGEFWFERDISNG